MPSYFALLVIPLLPPPFFLAHTTIFGLFVDLWQAATLAAKQAAQPGRQADRQTGRKRREERSRVKEEATPPPLSPTVGTGDVASCIKERDKKKTKEKKQRRKMH